MKAKISVVIPVFNEEETIDELVERCVAALESMERPYEIVLVDDGSADSSREKIEASTIQYGGRVRGVFLNRNYGQHNAVIAGFAHSDGQLVITLDADLQNPPEEIPRLAAKADEGYDVVGTVRRNRQDSIFRRAASHLINVMVMKTTGVMMHDYGCMLRCYDRRVVNAILECRERSTFVPVLGNGFARQTSEIEVGHAERKTGVSKYGFMNLINLMFDLMTSMTTLPLRLLSLTGLVMSIFGIAFGALLIVLRLIQGPEWSGGGVFTLLGVAFFFLGAQFIALGLIGEYLGRIQIDVRERPRYLVDRIVGASGTLLSWGPETTSVSQPRTEPSQSECK